MSIRKNPLKLAAAIFLLLVCQPLLGLNCPTSVGKTDGNKYACDCSCDWQSSIHDKMVTWSVSDTSVCAKDSASAAVKCKEACKDKLHRDVYFSKYNKYTRKYYGCRTDSVTLTNPNYCDSSKLYGLCGEPAYANNEGIVDFGRSYLELSIPSNGDYAKVPVKGKVSIVGANCPTDSCSAEVWNAEFTPKDGDFTTTQGSSVTGLALYNLGIWDGTKLADETLELGTHQAALKAAFDGSDKYYELTPKNHISGKINYRTVRNKNGSSDMDNNSLVITGQFTSSEVNVKLHIHVWLVDCQPSVTATASCSPGIETNDCAYGNLFSSTALLSNMDSADICSALQVEDYTTVCTAGSGEFAAFYCNEDTTLKGLTPTQQAARLNFHWTDADDEAISYSTTETLYAMPEFPVFLTVTNEFGREAKTSIETPPSGGCPPTDLGLFDTQWGTADAGEGFRYVVQDAPAGDYKFSTSGTHDADLYVRVGDEPTLAVADCASESATTTEECSVTLAAGDDIHVLVSGWDNGSEYGLLATWEGFDASGTVASGDKDLYSTPLLPAGTYRFTMTGDNDADLYVSTGFGPFVEVECYPYELGSNETCELHLDDTQAFNIAVNGYAPSSAYQLKAEIVSLDSLGETLVWDGTFGTVHLVDEIVWPIWM